MIAKHTVFIEVDNVTRADSGVTTTPPLSGRVLVRAGSEIVESQLAKYPGALEAALGTKKAPKGEELQTQEPPETKDREKKHHGKGH